VSKTVLVQARISPEVKADVEKLFEAWGFDISTAFRMFLNKVSRDKAMPFIFAEENQPTAEELHDMRVLGIKKHADLLKVYREIDAARADYEVGRGASFGSVAEMFKDTFGEPYVDSLSHGDVQRATEGSEK